MYLCRSCIAVTQQPEREWAVKSIVPIVQVCEACGFEDYVNHTIRLSEISRKEYAALTKANVVTTCASGQQDPLSTENQDDRNTPGST